jgi:predicted secreted protein
MKTGKKERKGHEWVGQYRMSGKVVMKLELISNICNDFSWEMEAGNALKLVVSVRYFEQTNSKRDWKEHKSNN